MDIREWLQHVDNRDAPEVEPRTHTGSFLSRDQHETYVRARRLLPADDGSGFKSRPRKRTDNRCARSDSQTHSSSIKYRRRARRKTREDRYELKQQESRPEHRTAGCPSKANRRHIRQPGSNTLHGFELDTRSHQHRLTLDPSRAGLFSRGSTVAITKHQEGIPDLSFNELSFLQRPVKFDITMQEPAAEVQDTESHQDNGRIFDRPTTHVLGNARLQCNTPSFDIPRSSRGQNVRSALHSSRHMDRSMHSQTEMRDDGRVAKRQKLFSTIELSTSMPLPSLSVMHREALPVSAEEQQWRSSSSVSKATMIGHPDVSTYGLHGIVSSVRRKQHSDAAAPGDVRTTGRSSQRARQSITSQPRFRPGSEIAGLSRLGTTSQSQVLARCYNNEDAGHQLSNASKQPLLSMPRRTSPVDGAYAPSPQHSVLADLPRRGLQAFELFANISSREVASPTAVAAPLLHARRATALANINWGHTFSAVSPAPEDQASAVAVDENQAQPFVSGEGARAAEAREHQEHDDGAQLAPDLFWRPNMLY